jgi:hypothetical protein
LFASVFKSIPSAAKSLYWILLLVHCVELVSASRKTMPLATMQTVVTAWLLAHYFRNLRGLRRVCTLVQLYRKIEGRQFGGTGGLSYFSGVRGAKAPLFLCPKRLEADFFVGMRGATARAHGRDARATRAKGLPSWSSACTGGGTPVPYTNRAKLGLDATPHSKMLHSVSVFQNKAQSRGPKTQCRPLIPFS